MSLNAILWRVALLALALYAINRFSGGIGSALVAWYGGAVSGDAWNPDGSAVPGANGLFGDPVRLPYPEPKNEDEAAANSYVTGIIPNGWTRDQWIDYQTTGVWPS